MLGTTVACGVWKDGERNGGCEQMVGIAEIGRRPAIERWRPSRMTEAGDFVVEVWREANMILQDLADGATTYDIVVSVFRKVEPTLAHTDEDPHTDEEKNKQLVALLQTTRDICVAHLLYVARRDPSTPRGDSRSLHLLLRFFDPQIRAAVRRRICCPDDLEPVVNDVHFRISKRLQAVDDGKRFEGGRGQLHYYVERTCESACTDCGRRKPKGVQFVDPDDLLEACQDDGRQYAIVDLVEAMRSSLPLLSAEEQQAVHAFLRFEGDWAAAHEALGVPRQTLASRFQRAVGKLRRLWGPDD